MDSIIFDLDGTLWDASNTIVEAWNKVLHKNSYDQITKEKLQGVTGLQMKEIFQVLFPDLNDDKQNQLIKECCEFEHKYVKENGGELYDNLEETLITLSKNYKLFIVSNCQDGYIEAFYDYHKLDKYFLDYENPGRTGLTKGENIKLVMERNNLANPIYVGDIEGDMNAAKFAGIPFMYASYGFGEVKQFDYSIDRFENILDVLTI
ncbi:HAD family hydrolase [Chengkuizengella axinellae]|uniref:HAD family hydrolase n=1 Tax=Chengkuizengella axinellae TaxID=3064388 RepID=A0ABT9J1G1_9BACL|nr:HAD family hydrolase [Chengkuizengella sp. 2205SS18-9]MDP5275461.1 HAD family hydrolase [Chengkuizengella sp. 2205SS18-9]